MAEPLTPTLLPLGDRALLIRFSEQLSDEANRAAIAMARQLERAGLDGVEEIAPGLVSVLLRLSPGTDIMRLSGEIRLRLGRGRNGRGGGRTDGRGELRWRRSGRGGRSAARHRADSSPGTTQRRCGVLATGFAPGFVYCGFHGGGMVVPRREQVRPMVPAGTVLFAAGQTAIAATPIRTGWHVIGKTAFQNFDPAAAPPTRLRPGDILRFVEAA